MRKLSRKAKIAIPVVSLVAVVTAIGIAGSDGGTSSKTPDYTAPDTATSAPQAPGTDAPDTQPPAPKPEPREADDVTNFRLSDQSLPGVPDYWVKYTVTNHSSKRSDYVIKWEAVNPQGVRVDNGEEYVDGLAPGQVTHEEDVTMLDTGNVKINVVSVDRTESY